MNYGISLVKYLLFIFNCIFTILGLIITCFGIWSYITYGDLSSIHKFAWLLQALFIILGATIFIIAFFGCCGAIQENKCMIITFAILLLKALIIQIAIGIWIFMFGNDIDAQELTTTYRNTFNAYWDNGPAQIAVDFIQRSASCCGVNSYMEFADFVKDEIPRSCCDNEMQLNINCTKSNAYKSGCAAALTSILQMFAEVICGIAISAAVIEVIGISLGFILVNSWTIDQRGYRF